MKTRLRMLLSNVIRFQKTLALAAAASNEHEAAAAELAARRIMDTCNIDPTVVPNASLYSRVSFADNILLKKLRAEWREQRTPPTPPPASPRFPPRVMIEDDITVTDFGSMSIPFNLDGFRKHTKNNRKKRRQRAQQVQRDYEQIRVLLNEGFKVAEVEELTGYTNVNSTRAYHLRKGLWLRDDDDMLQWADRRHAPAPTKPQPSDENAEENESTLVP